MKKLALLIPMALLAFACGGAVDAPTPGAPTPTVTTLPDTGRLAPGAGVVIGSITVEYDHPTAGPVTYTIDCFGDTFTITPAVDDLDAGAACAQIGNPEVLDRLVKGAPADRVCTEIYGGEDLARVTGTLDDAVIDTTFDRTNGCGIDDWDRLMAGVLPPAAGVAG